MKKIILTATVLILALIIPFSAYAKGESIFTDENGTAYVLDENGERFTGIYNNCYCKDGVIIKDTNGAKTVGGKKYYFRKGKLANGIFKEKKNKLIYVKNGVLQKKTGRVNYKKKSYYLKKGVAKSGIKRIKKKKYYFSKKNFRLLRSRDLKIDGKWYVANKKGVLSEKEEVFVKAKKRIKALTSKDDSDREKLHKCFKWTATKCRYSYKSGYYSPNGSDWVKRFASNMFDTRSGRCYSFAAVFAAMAKEIGYKDVKVVVGTCNGFGGRYIPHAWVEIKAGGKTRLFDPEYEYRHQNRNYNYAFNKEYGHTRAGYRVSYRVKLKFGSSKKKTEKKSVKKASKSTKGKRLTIKKVGWRIKGITFRPDGVMTKRMKKLADGKPEIATSCLAKNGYDVFYRYGNVYVTCFKKSKNAREYIYEIDINSGKLNNGVAIGEKMKSAKKKFGLKFKDEDGLFTCKKSGIYVSLYGEKNSSVNEIVLTSATLGR